MKVYGLGLKGEEAAKRYLRKKGFKILDTNYQCRFGEIDIIAQKKETIVFCEVKTRSEGMLAAPQESVDYFKQQKMIKTAQIWLQAKGIDDCPMRFDVLAVTVSAGKAEMEHIENAIMI